MSSWFYLFLLIEFCVKYWKVAIVFDICLQWKYAEQDYNTSCGISGQLNIKIDFSYFQEVLWLKLTGN